MELWKYLSQLLIHHAIPLRKQVIGGKNHIFHKTTRNTANTVKMYLEGKYTAMDSSFESLLQAITSGPSYSITNIRSEDSGEYYCEAQNIYGRHNSSSVSVDVQCKKIHLLHLLFKTDKWTHLLLHCITVGIPVFPQNTVSLHFVHQMLQRTSHITNITSENSGEYYCEAQNIYGCPNSSSVFVDVQCKEMDTFTVALYYSHNYRLSSCKTLLKKTLSLHFVHQMLQRTS
uniref:Immunoglobulin domain-containing protein n=1 Tax=Esox lucius TaxID=8010 RepID=A0AAY5KNR2_ESOLU